MRSRIRLDRRDKGVWTDVVTGMSPQDLADFLAVEKSREPQVIKPVTWGSSRSRLSESNR